MTKQEMEYMNELHSKNKALYEIHQDDVKLIKKLEEENNHYKELLKHFDNLLENLEKVAINLETIKTLKEIRDKKMTYGDAPKYVQELIKQLGDW
ncbi:MAG: hypothetical protein IKT40_03455 [Bacilli bacterium]|nr:hypothetical protein [Bacilli bacterium]